MAKGDKLYYKALHLAEQESYDYREVIRLLKKSIQYGNKKASYALASWYLNGFHVRKDYKKAFPLLKNAVEGEYEKGFILYKDALSDIAVCYELGNGVDRDLHKAFHYYLLAAFSGDAQALKEISRCLYYGIGVSKDEELSSVVDEYINQQRSDELDNL